MVQRTTDWTTNRIFALVLGIVLLLIGLFLGLTHINAADHILHLVIGLAAVAVGFMMHDDRVGSTTGSGNDPMVRP